MALYGTHIRFALDVRDDFDVKEIEKYIPGTVYPDSRYFSKIKRELTHDSRYEHKDFYQNDDFKKGWAAHLIYDHAQFQIMDEVFFELLAGETIVYGNTAWVTRTALKILQDMEDIQHFDLISCLPYLTYLETPNGESGDIIRKYNDFIIDLYKKAPLLEIDNYMI